ncbi:MAG: hypothetical protein E6G08_10575 [Actinobacteria bacterium]|nr:MAG: hypothetical protein E6G08_10575 [Actinomycetota bacterium]
MFGSDPHWIYDDPSGVPDENDVTVQLPEALLESARVEAARYGVTPAAWLVAVVEHRLRPTRPTAA